MLHSRKSSPPSVLSCPIGQRFVLSQSSDSILISENGLPVRSGAPPNGPSVVTDIQSLTSHHHAPLTSDRFGPKQPQPLHTPPSHNRDPSVTRGRTFDSSGHGPSPLSSQHRAQSARPQNTPDSNHSLAAGGLELRLERKPSNKYDHHRQTSVIHGIQHSRGPSSNSPSASPLSPELIAQAGLGGASITDTISNGRQDSSAIASSNSGLTLNGSAASPSIKSAMSEDTIIEGAIPSSSHQRTYTLGGRSRRGHGHHQSHSKHSADSKSPGEYALHHLVNSFVSQAEHKITQSVMNPQRFPNPVEQTCGPSVDPAFDRIISALGHIVRTNPKPLVDTLMLWRKKKGDQAASISRQVGATKMTIHPNVAVNLPHGPNNSIAPTFGNGLPNGSPNGLPHGLPAGLPRRNTEPVQPMSSAQEHQNQDSISPADSRPKTEDAEFMENRATVSIYLVCRVLIEIFQQSSLSEITHELYDRLEEIIYVQLKGMDPQQLLASNLRMANWRIYGELLGHMSNLNFASVTAKFLSGIEVMQSALTKSAPGPQSRDTVNRLELLIIGMRHIKIKTKPDECWNSSCDFIRALARLFTVCRGHVVKKAYCWIFENYLTAIAANPSSDFTVPKWREFLDILNTRLSPMVTKPHRWSDYYPLSAIALCVAPKEAFLNQLSSNLAVLNPKMKDRATKGVALQALARFAWTFTYRIKEPITTPPRKLEELLRVALPQGKKTQVSIELSLAEPLIQLLRIIGFRYQDLCFRTVIFPLINSEMFHAGKDLRIENMEPEKMVIGIRAFLKIVTDIESDSERGPPFPVPSSSYLVLDSLPTSPLAARLHLLGDYPKQSQDSLGMLSRPPDVSALPDLTKQYYLRFCEILGKIAILCDNAFGGQATLNERFGTLTPKTPLVDNFFVKKEDFNGIDYRQGFYELLHVAIQALPGCLSDHLPPFTTLVNLLCTGTAHVQTHIATSSAQSLKFIAKKSYAHQVTIGFARFIFAFDNKYSTMTEEGLLGLDHIENTLTLYIELLQIWREEVRHKSQNPLSDHLDPRGHQLDLSSALNYVDEIEAHGFFFLCSQSRRVRSYAIRVLRLVTEFDSTLGKKNTRIIHILESDLERILDLDDNTLNLAEKTRLQKGKRRSSASKSILVEICSSEVSYDSTLWSKAFPNVVRTVYQLCPSAVYYSRDTVCTRLLQMQQTIEELSGTPRVLPQNVPDSRRPRPLDPANEILVEQWKLYLITACVTLNSAGAQSQSQLANAAHARKISKPSQFSPEKLGSARGLFAAVIPLLGSVPDVIRNAVVTALGSINTKLYRVLLESLQYAVIKCNDEAKQRIGLHHRNPSSPARNRLWDPLRTEVTHVYRLTSQFLRDSEVRSDDWIMNNLINYTKDLRIFLSDAEVQNDWDLQQLRIHYCGLMEEVFDGINRLPVPSRWMPFESRKSAFTLMEEWCGYSPNPNQAQRREDTMRLSAVAHQNETGERVNNSMAAMEIQKKNLRTAALSAMASLCAGPIMVTTESKAILQLNPSRLLSWIGSILGTTSDKLHVIGRRALQNLIGHNQEYPSLMDHAVERCYSSNSLKAFESYFAVVTGVLIDHPDYPLPFWKILALVLFTLGTDNQETRMKSAQLLPVLEARQQISSKLQDFDIGISDKTTVVYKRAQFEYSKRLSSAHGDLAFIIFSEFALHFKSVNTDHQRNMVAAILPWIQTVELQLDPGGGPTASSQMLLSNLFEITIRMSNVLHNEVQALWQALGAGPHAGNVQLALDFIINLCLERREQNFVDYARQIVVYLSGTAAGSKVVEFFLMQMVPKNMVFEKKGQENPAAEPKGFPYVADLSSVATTNNRPMSSYLPADTAAPSNTQKGGFSLGQLSLIFLVDLVVAPIELQAEQAVKLIHVTLMLWDHHIQTVREQAREMLVHLIHESVTSKLDETALSSKKPQIESLVEAIRQNAPNVVWAYNINSNKEDIDPGSRVPFGMAYLTEQVDDLFAASFEGLGDLWAKEALGWASSCPVRHLACRSFQIFRCISVSMDSRMLADMLARLSNTIADEEVDYQNFSLEILITLKVIISSLSPQDLLHYPQLFWTTCACLNTIHEQEFLESLGMLDKLISKLDLKDPGIASRLIGNKPSKWEGTFDGLEILLYKGLKSSETLEPTLAIMDALADLPDNELTGSSIRFLYTLLANLPVFTSGSVTESPWVRFDRAGRLAGAARSRKLHSIAQCLEEYAGGHLQDSQFLRHIVPALHEHYFPQHDSHTLVFLMGFLTNRTAWFRLKTAELLCLIIPLVDMRRPEISSHGPDVISPLLRLLTTNHMEEALKVMDHIMEVFPNPNERQHLRMSLTSGRDRSVRKEYDNTKSLYGIPEPSGWSIPMPAVYSNLARTNVHAVFYTCADIESVGAQATTTPEIEFRSDDYSESYFPGNRTATMKSVDTGGSDHNIGDLVQKLDSLDDFFDDVGLGMEPTAIPDFSSEELADHGTNVYDQQTAPILRKSLNRTASTSSFRDGLAESHSALPRDPSIMTPMAFASAAPSTVTAGPPTSSAPYVARPGLHSRSITSPANNFPTTHPTSAQIPLIPNLANGGGSFLSDDEFDERDGGLSDVETPFPTFVNHSIGPAQSVESSIPLPLGPTPIPRQPATPDGPFSFGTMKRGMRRLTGGKGDRERERQRDGSKIQYKQGSGGISGPGAALAGSPRVPRVPLEYLNGNSPTSPGI